jgi:Icc-related predicted phosphoesterase
MAKNGIIVCGDIHGEYEKLNMLINRHRPSMVLQCGDFGYFPKWHAQSTVNSYGKSIIIDQYSISTNGVPVHWCDGNHDDHHSLQELSKNNPPCFIEDVYYQKRGSYITLPDGRNVLFMGGAFSVDRAWRELNESYWLEEVLTEKDLQNLPDVNIDIVISHTAPTGFKLPKIGDKEYPDKSRDILQYVFEKYRPKIWKFGHFHINFRGTYKGCNWEALAHCSSMMDKWWVWLK